MNGVSSALVIVSMIIFLGCEDKETKAQNEYLQQQIAVQEEEKRLAIEAQKEKDEAEKRVLQDNIDKQTELIQETQDKIDQQLEKDRLKEIAENEPVSISSISIKNFTQYGSELESKSLRVFKENEVKYIGWSADYTSNIVKAGGKTNGKLYVKYIKKDTESDSWSVFNSQSSFTKADGTYNEYSSEQTITDNGSENGTWSGSLGTTSGYDFGVGKWKIELYWDKNSEGKAIYLYGEYFEVY
jgi:hypothetical protein